MMLAFGMVAALLHAKQTGQGQVIDCAMTDGAAVLMAMIWGFRANGIWRDERGVNLLDTGAHMYDTYECSDGRWISIGSLEPQFYALLLEKTGLSDDPAFAAQMDASQWPALKERLAALFRTRTRDEWCAIMEMTDVCFAPVLTMAEAPHHPHNAARGTLVEADGVMQPAPAPRYSATIAELPPMTRAADTDAILAELGCDAATVAALKAAGTVR
jgi:alpha-methylacyl-CoA racemase